MSAFPPRRSIPSVPLTQEVALKYLQTYLEATKSSPHLLPNARIEASGPTAGTSNSSVTMHNLQRVEAGLRGEWLAPNLDLGENNVKVAKGMDDGTNTGDGEGDHMQVDGWQDLDEYQREQSIEEGEVGPSQTGIAQEGDEVILNQIVEEELPKPKNVRRTRENGGATEEQPKKAKDKEARKKEKKVRHKEEQRRKEEERRKHSKGQ
jgi:hypothetical protein